MVLLSGSGTGGGIYANLANGGAGHNCPRAPLPTIHRCYDLVRVVNKRIIANAFIEARFVTKSRLLASDGLPRLWRGNLAC
jgi:hypothetical protein